MAYNHFNFLQYLKEYPFETWKITKTINFPQFIRKILSTRIPYPHIYFDNFQVFNPENCLDFLVEVLLQFPKNWYLKEIHFIEEDTTSNPQRGYPDLYTIYRVDTGNTELVNLDFLKNLHNGEATIFSYYDTDGFLNILTIQKA